MAFGIPLDDAAYEGMNEVVTANTNDLMQIAAHAADTLRQQIGINKQELGRFTKPIRTRLKSVLEHNAADLTQIGDAATTALAVTTSANAADVGANIGIVGLNGGGATSQQQQVGTNGGGPGQPGGGGGGPPIVPPGCVVTDAGVVVCPPPPPPPPVGAWFCYLNCVTFSVQIGQSSPGSDWSQAGGPFADAATALDWCGRNARQLIDSCNQPPPPPPENWFCYLNCTTSRVDIGQTSPGVEWNQAGGPFPDAATALAWCGDHARQLIDSCQPPPPPTGDKWYCYLNCTTFRVQIAQERPGPDWDLEGGPWDTAQEALQWCGDNARQLIDSCPPRPPAGGNGGPPFQPPPGTVCNNPPTLAPPQCNAFPVPGSQEWCENYVVIKGMLADIGGYIIEFIEQVLDPNNLGQDIACTDPGVLQGGLLGQVSYWWCVVKQTLQCLSKAVLQTIQAGYNWVRAFATCVLPCSPDEMLRLWALKTAVRFLKLLRIGTDAGIWATADISLSLDQLEIVIDYLTNALCPVRIPGIPEAIECYLQGTVPEGLAQCWIAMNGGDWNVWLHIIQARRQRLDSRELIEYGRRNSYPEESILDGLQQLGYVERQDARNALYLYDRLPTIGDHLHWLQRNVFNQEYVDRYQLLDGFEDRFWARYGPDLYAQGVKKEYAANHYAAHWIMPSPEQMRQFVFRLRPGRVPDDVAFTAADYDRILQEQDYNVLARKWFTATINPVPAISYIKQMYQLGAIDAAQLKEYHMDLGYKEADAANFVKVDQIQRQRQLTSSGHGFTPAAMASAFALGRMPASEVQDRMRALGYPDDIAADLLRRSRIDLDRTVLLRARSRSLTALVSQVTASIKVGIMSQDDAFRALTQAGWPGPEAQSLALQAESQANTDMAKAAIGRIRSAFLAGEIDREYVLQMLINMGILPNKIKQYLTLWAIEQTPSRKRRTASQITNDVCIGQLTAGEALVRLNNLGYNDSDQRLFMADAQRCVVKGEAKKRAAELKVGRQRAAELARLARQAEANKRRLINDLRRMEPVAKLQKWLRFEIISEEYFNGRLTLYGYTPGEIIALSEEARSGKKPPATYTPPKP